MNEKHQNDVWFYLKLYRALILACALVETGLTELTGGQQHQTKPNVIGGLNAHGLTGYRCDRCLKTDVQNDAKETVWVLICIVIQTIRDQ